MFVKVGIEHITKSMKRNMLWGALCALCAYVGGMPSAQAEGFLPSSGIKASYSPLAIPTRFTPVGESLEALLNRQYRVVAAHDGDGEEVLVLTKAEKVTRADSTVICALTMPNPVAGQMVTTSRCWALNYATK